ncbi:M28 family metallopeptidase [Nonomuraea sp. NPDC046570]|uniref:M28 family metallopeptidase n=1 Tax=Nonomuraea sp. NPDC046570 TaxID=3155255 RepID=UPI003409FCBD
MITHTLLLLALAAPGSPLVDAVSGENALHHLRAFQAIADAHGGNRAAGTPGHDASAAYVADRLREAGYEVEMQPFTFDFYRELEPARVLSGRHVQQEVTTLAYSGSGKVRARPQRVGRGCADADFKRFVPRRIAVVQRGVCSFAVKTANAVQAGARAVVVVNQDGPFRGTLGKPQRVPVVGVPAKAGKRIGHAGRVTVQTKTSSETRTTHNVIAQTRAGSTHDVVMVGAHLDSVLEGPGINDNGSGSAAVLEIALQTAKFTPQRAVRFAWWGAEEEGLLGSTHYVKNLSAAQRADIEVYLNLDMVASTNHIYGIYDGDDSDKMGAGPGPEGSAKVEKAFERFYQGRGLPYRGTDFDGRSDYGPFIAAGIAAGGLFTGAEAVKTPEEAKLFGGTAGAPYDPCYHKACDDLRNVNSHVLDINTDAVAAVVAEYAGAM